MGGQHTGVFATLSVIQLVTHSWIVTALALTASTSEDGLSVYQQCLAGVLLVLPLSLPPILCLKATEEAGSSMLENIKKFGAWQLFQG